MYVTYFSLELRANILPKNNFTQSLTAFYISCIVFEQQLF